MKKIFYVLVIASFCIISSCSKTPTPTTTGGYLTFTINGSTNYIYKVPNDMEAFSSAGVNSALMVANDSLNTSNILTMNIGGSATGTYPFLSSNSTNISYQIGSTKTYSTTNSLVTNGKGSVALTVNGTSCTATFNTVLYNNTNASDSLILTNGSYIGPYN